MAAALQPYTSNGVLLSSKSVKVGDEVTISYSGLLAQNGADMIYAHTGYNEAWEESAFIPMSNEEGSFKTTIMVTIPGILNIAFKDSANNWDNNSASNYTFKVSKGTSPAGKSSTGSKVEKKVQPAAKKSEKKPVKKEEIKAAKEGAAKKKKS